MMLRSGKFTRGLTVCELPFGKRDRTCEFEVNMSENQTNFSRREFAKRAVLAATIAVPVVASQETRADADEENTTPKRPPHEILTELVVQRFPHEKLTPEIIDLIRADIAGDLGRSIALEKFALKHSDEPGFVFAAWRAEG